VWQLDVAVVMEDSLGARQLLELLQAANAPRCNLTHVDSLDELRPRLDRARCDVLIVDLALGDDGIETYRSVRAAAQSAALIVLVDEPRLGERALREGAEDYLGRDELSTQVLTRAMRYAVSRKKAQAQLRRAQRMEAIGQLASGIAHDFNNLITVLHGHAELLLELDTEPHVRESVQGIKDASERASQLTRQLLNFSQRQTTRMQATDLNRVVIDFSKMLRRVLGSEVRLQLELSTEPPAALADIGLVEQVLLNLAINARDAMPNGGELILRTGKASIEAGASTNPDSYAGMFVTLAVSDTGSGISPEILSRIWEPFVTTKEAGKGTGLGLAIVQNIVQQHRGFIEVTSEIDVGTTFEIYLPLVEPESETSEPSVAETAQPGTENILLVDDETPVRQLVRMVLERQGYRILEARSGPDALITFDESPTRIDLVLADLMMPGGMSGIELARELRRRDPELRVIYTSGYGPGYSAPDLVLTEGENFLAKPYVLSRLIGTVRRALDVRASEQGSSDARAALPG